MKRAFLDHIGVRDEAGAMSNSIQSALAHNPTYIPEADDARRAVFRSDLTAAMRALAPSYVERVSAADHVANIEQLRKGLTDKHGDALRDGRLRFGTAQKALNLYLKFLWCLQNERAIPPHCPVDRIILESVGIDKAWTQLDSSAEYEKWMETIETEARQLGFETAQEWDLAVWNRASETALPGSKLEQVAMALLSMTMHGDRHGMRAWKGMDWGLLDRLFEQGWICDPKGKARSVAMTEEGAQLANQFFELHFGDEER